MQTVEKQIHGLRQRFYAWGDEKNPPMFFLHGWMDTGASFDFITKYLENDYYCIAPDMRGYGHSEHPSNELGSFYYEYVADVHQMLEIFSPDKPVMLVGHSLGGNIASTYAGTFPERISHLVNIEGLGIHDMPLKDGPKRVRQWIEELDVKPFRVYKTLNDFAERLRQSNPRLPQDRALFLAKKITIEVPGGYTMAADPRHKMIEPYLYRLENIMPFWKSITAKCLLIWAEETEMAKWIKTESSTEDEVNRRFALFPQGSKKVMIPGCGHMVHHEKPEELAQVMLKFF